MQHPPIPGRAVWVRGRRWRVERAALNRGIVRIDVADRADRRAFLLPYDHAAFSDTAGRPVRVRRSSGLARLAGLMASRTSIRNLVAARDAAIDIHPYQLEAALAIQAGRRRVLIADAVGLGKTIQAGLAIADLLRRTPDARVLVIAPAGLLDQWRGELAGRFQVTTRIADRGAIECPHDLPRFGADPWQHTGVWLASPDYLKQPHVLDNLFWRRWDMVVVDEAHTASGDSARHRAVSSIGRRARRVLLLTATPHSGDQGDFDRLIGIGALDHADGAVLVLRRGRADVGFAVTRHVRWHRVRLAPASERLLAALTDFERLASDTTNPTQHQGAGLLATLLWRRVSSTVAALARSLERRLSWLDAAAGGTVPDWAQPGLDFGDGEADGDVDERERLALTGDTGLRPQDERGHVGRLLRLARAAIESDPKLTRLSALTARSREPLVVFTEFRDSLDAARHAFGHRTIAILHGGLTLIERRRALAAFLNGPASVLLTTDVGGVGLNLQHRTRWVVSLDLPWNPVRLEQRIGRVDRIGQTKTVHATLLAAGAGDERIRGALTRRVAAARRMNAAPESFSGLVSDRAAHHGHLREAAADEARLPAPTLARHARAAARLLARDRAFASRWRGHEPRARPWYVDASSTRASRGRTFLGFSVLIVGDGAAVVEDTVVVVVVPRPLNPRRLPAAVIGRARELATARLLARLARVRRLDASRQSLDEAVDAAMTETVAREARPAPSQLPLFTGAWRSKTTRSTNGDTVDRPNVMNGARGAPAGLTPPELIWIWID